MAISQRSVLSVLGMCRSAVLHSRTLAFLALTFSLAACDNGGETPDPDPTVFYPTGIAQVDDPAIGGIVLKESPFTVGTITSVSPLRITAVVGTGSPDCSSGCQFYQADSVPEGATVAPALAATRSTTTFSASRVWVAFTNEGSPILEAATYSGFGSEGISLTIFDDFFLEGGQYINEGGTILDPSTGRLSGPYGEGVVLEFRRPSGT